MSSLFNIILTHSGNISDFKLINSEQKVFHFPMIKIKIFDDIEVKNIDSYDFAIFSSKNSVEAFTKLTNKKKNKFKALCVGHKIKKKLELNGIQTHFTSSKSYKTIFIKELLALDIMKNKKTVYFAGNLSDNYIEKSLEKKYNIERINIYETIKNNQKNYQLTNLLTQKNTIGVFNSPSAFINFSENYDLKNLIIATIGETTANFIKDLNYKVEIISSKQTFKDLSRKINIYCNKKNS